MPSERLPLLLLRLLLLLLLLPPARVAAAAGSEPGDPNQHAAPGPSGHLCEAGHYLTEDCYIGQARGCCPCPPGTFMSHPNREASCGQCTPCRKDQEMVRDCTPTRNRQCRCKPGEYYCDSEHCPESCHRCTSCPGAALQACTATRDTVCAPGASAQPGHAADSLAVSAMVVSLVVLVIMAIAQWWRGGVPCLQWMCRFTKRKHLPCSECSALASRKPVSAASVEPGSHGHTLQTTAPESSPLAPDTETTPMLQEEADTPPPGAQTRPGPSADPDPDPRAGVELQVEVEVDGGVREAPEPAPPTPAAAASRALPWAEAPASLRPPEQEHKRLFGEGRRRIGSLVNVDPRPQDGARAS